MTDNTAIAGNLVAGVAGLLALFGWHWDPAVTAQVVSGVGGAISVACTVNAVMHHMTKGQ
jgi:uncharacterized protein (DUF697 family)